MCDDECPSCAANEISPYDSDDLSSIIIKKGSLFAVFVSPTTAEHAPDYRLVLQFPTRSLAELWLSIDPSQRTDFLLG